MQDQVLYVRICSMHIKKGKTPTGENYFVVCEDKNILAMSFLHMKISDHNFLSTMYDTIQPHNHVLCKCTSISPYSNIDFTQF